MQSANWFDLGAFEKMPKNVKNRFAVQQVLLISMKRLSKTSEK